MLYFQVVNVNLVVLHLLLLAWVGHDVLLLVISVLLLNLLDALVEIVGLKNEGAFDDELCFIEEEDAGFVVFDCLVFVIIAVFPKDQVLLLPAYFEERVVGLLYLRQDNWIESVLQLVINLQLTDLEDLRRLLDQIAFLVLFLDGAELVFQDDLDVLHVDE